MRLFYIRLKKILHYFICELFVKWYERKASKKKASKNELTAISFQQKQVGINFLTYRLKNLKEWNLLEIFLQKNFTQIMRSYHFLNIGLLYVSVNKSCMFLYFLRNSHKRTSLIDEQIEGKQRCPLM